MITDTFENLSEEIINVKDEGKSAKKGTRK